MQNIVLNESANLHLRLDKAEKRCRTTVIAAGVIFVIFTLAEVGGLIALSKANAQISSLRMVLDREETVNRRYEEKIRDAGPFETSAIARIATGAVEGEFKNRQKDLITREDFERTSGSNMQDLTRLRSAQSALQAALDLASKHMAMEFSNLRSSIDGLDARMKGLSAPSVKATSQDSTSDANIDLYMRVDSNCPRGAQCYIINN